MENSIWPYLIGIPLIWFNIGLYKPSAANWFVVGWLSSWMFFGLFRVYLTT